MKWVYSVWAVTVLLSIITLLGFLARHSWWFEAATSFRTQYFLVLATCTVMLGIARQKLAAVFAGSFAAIKLVVIVPISLVAAPAIAPQAGPRVLTLNVHHRNDHYEGVIELIRREAPDVVVLSEFTTGWEEGLRELESVYRYSKLLPQRPPGPFGIALYSRVPLEDVQVHYLGGRSFPCIVATVQGDERPWTLIGVHLRAPIRPRSFQLQARQFRELADLVGLQTRPCAVLGDFNATPWSPRFHDFKSRSGLRDSRGAWGIQPTWPVHNPLMRIPIDHCLASESIRVGQRRIVDSDGSDHFGLVVDLVLDER